MIVRKQVDGSFVLISQPDHARLSGLLAAHWGNQTFAYPEPRESVIRAAAYHDCGWASYEARPTYDLTAKAPPTHQQVPVDAEQLAAFQRGLDWLWDMDAYAGLLISRHRTGLWRQRYGAIALPAPPPARVLSPEASAFLAGNEQKQERAFAGLDRLRFDRHYQLLQVLDLISLFLCTGEPKDGAIGPVPVSFEQGGSECATITLSRLDDRLVKVDPYPFDLPEIAASFVYLHLPPTEYGSVTEFRRAYFGTPQLTRAFTLVR